AFAELPTAPRRPTTPHRQWVRWALLLAVLLLAYLLGIGLIARRVQSMVASVRSVSSATSTSATFSVTKPTGTANGDLLVAFESCSNDTPAAPSGWTLYDSLAYSGLETFRCYYKVAASE